MIQIRRVAALLGVLAMLVMPSAPAQATSSPWDDAVASASRLRAHIQVTLHTSSDWAQVDLPGVVSGHVVDPATHDLVVRPTGHGFVVNGEAGRVGAAVVDMVVEVHPDATRVAVALKGGSAGGTMAEVVNRTTGDTRVAALTSWSNTRQIMRADEFLAGADLELVRRTQGRLDLAFLYPWFDEWATTASHLPVHPVDPYRSLYLDSATAHASRARAVGIEGFVLSFSGQRAHGLALHQALEAAAATDGTVAALIEPVPESSDDTPSDWVTDALAKADHPAYLRLDGSPVVFAFGTWAWSAETWASVGQVAADHGALLVVDSIAPPAVPVAGVYWYDALHDGTGRTISDATREARWRKATRFARSRATIDGSEPRVSISTVSPGYDDGGTKQETVDRAGTATYESTWRAAAAGDPDWVLITSWNEWYEGTGIAPSVEYGDTALEVTARWDAG